MPTYEDRHSRTAQPTLSSYGTFGDSRTTRLDMGPVVLWYSYKALIAYKVNGDPIVIRENQWGSRMTGKHMNLIADKSCRIPSKEFDRRWNIEVAPLMHAAEIAVRTTLKSESYLSSQRKKRRRVDVGISGEKAA